MHGLSWMEFFRFVRSFPWYLNGWMNGLTCMANAEGKREMGIGNRGNVGSGNGYYMVMVMEKGERRKEMEMWYSDRYCKCILLC